MAAKPDPCSMIPVDAENCQHPHQHRRFVVCGESMFIGCLACGGVEECWSIDMAALEASE